MVLNLKHSITNYRNIKKKIYLHDLAFVFLILLEISFFYSRIALSICEIIIMLIWLIDAKWIHKFKKNITNKEFLLILLIYLIHIIGLLYSDNLNWALKDLKIKLPFLIFPLFFITYQYNYKKLRLLFLFFIWAVIIKIVFAFILYFLGFSFEEIQNHELSGNISSIRFSISIVFAIVLLTYLSKKQMLKNTIYHKAAIYSALLILFIYILILKSIIALIILYILFLLFLKKYFFKHPIYTFIFIFLPFIYVIYVALTFYPLKTIEYKKIEKRTANNNFYLHDTNTIAYENANHVWLYICEKELKKEWNQKSTTKYDSFDKKGNQIKYTLTRYLTSLDLPKDSIGVNSLTKKDIKNIEIGLSNYKFQKKISLYNQVYIMIWEIDNYLRGNNPSGHPIAQRIEYLIGAFSIIKNNWLTGVGTGDVGDSFKTYYKKSDTKLEKRYQLRTHNQIVTFFLTFGIFGGALITFALVYPLTNKKNRHFLFIATIITVFLSMLSEDTFETQHGVTITMYFYSISLFAIKKE